MVRILRVRQAGSGSGGTGNPKPAPGAQGNIRSGDANIEQASALLRVRMAAARVVARTSIGSKGRL